MFKNLIKALKGLWEAFLNLFRSPIKTAENKSGSQVHRPET